MSDAGNPLDRINSAIAEAAPSLGRICAEVWEEAELSSAETNSAAIHIRELEAAGFTITSRGTSGQTTAFIAEWEHGTGGPKIGYLPEYDALPGLSNAAVPRKELPANGKTSGHGCGHNMLGAGCTVAAIALKSVMESEKIDGLLRVYGCAAEEALGAKVFMASDGLFNDLDGCLAWHSAPMATTGHVRSAALNDISVEFHGKSAHAGNDPWHGRSALDALELFAHSLNLMREHVEPTARIQYIIESGGDAPNIVPDYARMALRIREKDRGRVDAISTWARAAADGAAMSTQTTASFNIAFGLHDIVPNKPLIERLYAHLQDVGVPAWTEDEQSFARECQRNSDLPEAGLTTSVSPLLPEMTLGGSSDVGDVSWNTPTVVLAYPSFPIGVSLHSWPVTACGGMSIGLKSATGAATILARTGLDLLLDEGLRKEAKTALESRLNGQHYVSPLPADWSPAGSKSVKDGTDSLTG